MSRVISFFFCKQKPAYEMRISDWSSDVCSSDLVARVLVAQARGHADAHRQAQRLVFPLQGEPLDVPAQLFADHSRRRTTARGQHRDELLAAVAPQQVAVAERRTQSLRHHPQAMVAAGMTIFVVDCLAMVHVDEQDRKSTRLNSSH